MAHSAGRLLSDFEPALQLAVALGDSNEAAASRFLSSRVHTHLTSLRGSTMRGRLGDLVERNLVGDPDRVAGRIQSCVEAGDAAFAGLLFAADTVEETLDQMEWFADDVMSSFSDG
jgi:alkanesulfonate monooxygenase SsuD/methylene tetrahydromethanopterin reductase-like flavin-dependent oxidoreductase (luciferase family)